MVTFFWAEYKIRVISAEAELRQKISRMLNTLLEYSGMAEWEIFGIGGIQNALLKLKWSGGID